MTGGRDPSIVGSIGNQDGNVSRGVRAGLVSAIVVNYEGGEFLQRCLISLREQRVPLEIVVVDNGSSDGSVAEAVRRFPEVQVMRPAENLGFAGGANLGARRARGEFLLFLNPDVELVPGCVEALLRELSDPRVAVCGPALRQLASGVVEFGATVDLLGYPVALSVMRAPLFVSGCALATRADVFDALGGFDERFFLFVEDVDYCWRALLRGWDVRVANGAVAVHAGGASTPGGYLTEEGLDTTRMRVALRERNTLAMMLKCWGAPSWALVVPAYVVQGVLTALLLGVLGRFRTAASILGGLAWNVCELPHTLALRRDVQAGRRISDWKVLTRMALTLRKVELLIRYGIPRIQES